MKGTQRTGQPYGEIYEPLLFGSAGGGPGGGAGGGRIWLNVSNTLLLDGRLSANGENGRVVNHVVGGGGSGGSVWIHAHWIKGFGKILSQGGDGAYVNHQLAAGGGSGGRVALHFKVNETFSEFRYLASGGEPGGPCDGCEAGGAGTVFIYHLLEDHRTLIIDNNGTKYRPRSKEINWNNFDGEGSRAWILPMSGKHSFASNSSKFHFEELQIYGNAHFAIKSSENVSIFFKYMIGDRTGYLHVAENQTLDLTRREIDLPFSCIVYSRALLGLAPMTFVHGVELYISGTVANVKNLTLHHGGYLWLRDGGKTAAETWNHYKFDFVRIQDTAVVNVSIDPISSPGIRFTTLDLHIEGGGILHGAHITMVSVNITVDAGGMLSADGLGYNSTHKNVSHGAISLHGSVNQGYPDGPNGIGCGGGHGGSGGRAQLKTQGIHPGGGLAYGDMYEPDFLGSAGAVGPTNLPGGAGKLIFNFVHSLQKFLH